MRIVLGCWPATALAGCQVLDGLPEESEPRPPELRTVVREGMRHPADQDLADLLGVWPAPPPGGGRPVLP